MPGIGSPEWVAALDAALRAVDDETTGDVVIQQELSDADAAWHLVVAGGQASACVGRHASPDVTLTQDETTAAAINAGTLSAQTAFIDGRLRVRGRVDRLTEVAALFGRLAHVPATGRR
jgi:putative sterol carrier protein